MNSTRINLVYLPHPYLNDPIAQLPLGILYVASSLKKNNYRVIVSNLSSYKSNSEAIQSLKEADVFGITITSLELIQANEFAKELKTRFPKCKIILGGAGTFTPEYIDWNYIDSICQGEGEITILEMIKDAKSNSLKRIYKGIVVKDLDSIPYPDRESIGTLKLGGHIFANHKTYDKTFSVDFKNKGTTTIITSRGCPFKCSFCAAPAINYNMRFRNPKEVYKEIKYLYDKYKIKQYRFSDEMFTANPKHVKEVCELIKPLGLVWRISARVKPLSLDILKTMRSAGCMEISFGVESFDNDVLKVLNKGTTAQDNLKAIYMAKKAGMMVRILFMIRTPGQTPNTIKRNIECLTGLDYDTIAVTSFVPLPGSEIWNNPDKFNVEILNKNLEDYNFYFFGSSGKNKLKDIIKLKDRSLKELNEESEYFRQWIEANGRINRG